MVATILLLCKLISRRNEMPFVSYLLSSLVILMLVQCYTWHQLSKNSVETNVGNSDETAATASRAQLIGQEKHSLVCPSISARPGSNW
jgi:hypothetical protein